MLAFVKVKGVQSHTPTLSVRKCQHQRRIVFVKCTNELIATFNFLIHKWNIVGKHTFFLRTNPFDVDLLLVTGCVLWLLGRSSILYWPVSHGRQPYFRYQQPIGRPFSGYWLARLCYLFGVLPLVALSVPWASVVCFLDRELFMLWNIQGLTANYQWTWLLILSTFQGNVKPNHAKLVWFLARLFKQFFLNYDAPSCQAFSASLKKDMSWIFPFSIFVRLM